MSSYVIEQFWERFEKYLLSFSLRKAFFHPRLGDLSHPQAVIMPSEGLFPPIKREEDLLLHLTVTGRCNARCEGCINTSLTCEGRQKVLEVFESDPPRDARALASLILNDDKPQATIAFYGGEPLLALSKIKTIVELLEELVVHKRLRYMVYTNGQFLERAAKEAPELLSRIWLFSVSIDGRPAQHARFRKGTDLFVIRKGLRLLKENFETKVLHWSTIREGQSLWDCFEEFLYLYEEGLADYFFWHLAETNEPFKDFISFAARYGEELERILDVWEARLKEGKLLPLLPVNELLVFWLTGEKRGHSACGVELATNFDLVGGKVLACADLPAEFSLAELSPAGEIFWKGNGLLKSLVAYREILGCEKCGVFSYCGGRCPVQVLTGDPSRTLAYCELTRLFVGLSGERFSRLKETLSRFNFTPQFIYGHSACLARYTDVIP